jgi:hypothetical protein
MIRSVPIEALGHSMGLQKIFLKSLPELDEYGRRLPHDKRSCAINSTASPIHPYIQIAAGKYKKNASQVSLDTVLFQREIKGYNEKPSAPSLPGHHRTESASVSMGSPIFGLLASSSTTTILSSCRPKFVI